VNGTGVAAVHCSCREESDDDRLVSKRQRDKRDTEQKEQDVQAWQEREHWEMIYASIE
jgi:hypothetical protein